jgi:hypothetical protein
MCARLFVTTDREPEGPQDEAGWSENLRAEFVRRIIHLDLSDSRRLGASTSITRVAAFANGGWVDLSVELDDGTAIALGRVDERYAPARRTL